MIVATEAGLAWRKIITSVTTFCPVASMAKLLLSKLTWYQTALGPGATGGGLDATACGAFWAQAPSKEMAATAASWRHEIMRRDICISNLLGSRSRLR